MLHSDEFCDSHAWVAHYVSSCMILKCISEAYKIKDCFEQSCIRAYYGGHTAPSTLLAIIICFLWSPLRFICTAQSHTPTSSSSSVPPNSKKRNKNSNEKTRIMCMLEDMLQNISKFFLHYQFGWVLKNTKPDLSQLLNSWRSSRCLCIPSSPLVLVWKLGPWKSSLKNSPRWDRLY